MKHIRKRFGDKFSLSVKVLTNASYITVFKPYYLFIAHIHYLHIRSYLSFHRFNNSCPIRSSVHPFIRSTVQPLIRSSSIPSVHPSIRSSVNPTLRSSVYWIYVNSPI
ncbi:hypothetical protein BC937DRAFT_92870 [Endogone sp. FLAS-F59071]|nr:hypothetical protein BC937DRAFT_92870 [Endogone sp. FLAS-F59071]|eukprot:RUS21381.1 hypothetical protein BC937DRAFT_92870 [Endogone sp. FLAS-F59071]